MNFPALYPVTSLIISFVATTIFVWNLGYAVAWYRRRPREAWASVIVALALVVVGIGLTISAMGTLVADNGEVFAITGLSLARGALFICAVTLLVVGRQMRKN
jgi:ABC-type polysaccharide/polyol phosphate export permease